MNKFKDLPAQVEWDYTNIKVVVVVRNGETEGQAWRRHLTENPHDHQADIKIFHFAWPW
jgi:hypothetical protein